MKIDVLGTKYNAVFTTPKKDNRLNDMDGGCDNSIHEIFVNTYADTEIDEDSKRNLPLQFRKNVRHELIHAFLFESGLAENSDWAKNEEMVDFFAMQFPKMAKAFEQAKAMD